MVITVCVPGTTSGVTLGTQTLITAEASLDDVRALTAGPLHRDDTGRRCTPKYAPETR